jgi:hypothetical protein
LSSEPLVWILGAENSNADKSIPWNASDIPNLSDPDILIINLRSLDEITLAHIYNDTIRHTILEEQINSKLHSGGTIIFLTAPTITVGEKSSGRGALPTLEPPFSNYFLSPTIVWTYDVPEGRVIRYNKDRHHFKNFLDHVKKFNFYLEYNDRDSLRIVGRVSCNR